MFNSQYILREKRWKWIDYDKGISIILVSYGHCLGIFQNTEVNLNAYPFFNYISVFLFGFRMPLFFIISGVLVSSNLDKKGLPGYIKDRVSNILHPLLVWGILQISLQIISSAYNNTDNNIRLIDYLYLLINPRETGQFWYLNALFFIGVIYAFLKIKLKIKLWMQVILGLILFSIAAYVHLNNLKIGFLSDVCEFYFFFALGDFISKIILNQENVKRFSSWKIFLPLLLIFLLVQYYFTEINLFHGNVFFVEHKMPFFFLFEALVGCTFSISLSFLLQKHGSLPFLRIVGFHSLFIYCMQLITMTIVRMFLIKFVGITSAPLMITLVWVLGIVLPILFYNICLRLNLWWLFTFKKPEKQIEYLSKSKIFTLKRYVSKIY